MKGRNMTTGELIRDLCEYPSETEWLEFKENLADENEIGEYISALSNAAAVSGRRESYLVWGVSNEEHKIVGTCFDYNRDAKTHEPFQNFLARQLVPSVAFHFDEDMVDGKRVVLLRVPAAVKVPTAWQGKRFGRIGSSKVNLAKYPERESDLWNSLRYGVATIVNTASPYQNLTFQKLFLYYAAKGIELRSDTFETNLHLKTEDGKYNILARLVADNSDIPVRFSIFAGKTKADKMYSVKEFGNTCLFYAIDRIRDFGTILNVPQADEVSREVTRRDVPLFNQSAYDEAVFNAFIHNDWMSMDAPMFTAYEDRIEILSHGNIPSDQTMDGFFRGDSRPRCPELAKMFIQLHISESSGRGVPRIVKAYGKSAFEFGDGFIVTTIPFQRIHSVEWVPKPQSPEVSGLNDISRRNSENQIQEPAIRLTENQRKVFMELHDNPNMTVEELAANCGLSHSGTAKILSVLKQRNLIERAGNRRNGYWKIKQDINE